jgi:transposase
MPPKRRKVDQDFKDGAVRIAVESGRPIAEVARDLEIKEGRW